MDEEKKNGLDHQDDSSEINLENKQDLGETSEKTLEQNDSKIKNNVIKNIISTKFFIISSASLTAIILIVVLAVSGLFVHTHNFGEWKEIVSSKCETVGKSERVCECGEVETQRIPPMGHTPGEWVTDSTATCTTNGSKHQECLVCNETVNTQILSAFGHSEGNWVIDSNSTCTTNGSKHQVCSVCNATIKTETLPALGHTGGKWMIDLDATCTTNGSMHQVCSVCNATIKIETLPVFGHDYQLDSLENNGHVGSKIIYKCMWCNDTYEATIEELSINVRKRGTSSAIINGYGYYSTSWEVTVTGGYGAYEYKYEVYSSASSTTPISHLTQEYTDNNLYGMDYNGYGNPIEGWILKVTVRDSAGNTKEYRYPM